jgi:Fic family protein
MQPIDFKADAPGKVMRTPQNYTAFVPNSLPPSLHLGEDLIHELSIADRALGELNGVTRNLLNPHLLIGPFMRREAVLSSKIEGTQASLSELFFFEASGAATESSDIREVANYVRALEHGLKRLVTFPLSLRLIREMHEKLMHGVRGEHLTPGEFRRSQNWIGPPGCTLMDATYVPPPVEEMNAALDGFEKYLHTPSSLPPLLRLALIHYQFEAIHPFLDGNGRIGRLLISLLLCKEELLNKPFLYLSAYFERTRQEYYRHLLAVSQQNEWEAWLLYFVRGVAEQSHDGVRRTNQLLNLWKRYREKAQTTRGSVKLVAIIDDLFRVPALSAPHLTKQFNVTPRTAQASINKLISLGILKEVTGMQRNRVYVAQEIIRAVEA